MAEDRVRLRRRDVAPSGAGNDRKMRGGQCLVFEVGVSPTTERHLGECAAQVRLAG